MYFHELPEAGSVKSNEMKKKKKSSQDNPEGMTLQISMEKQNTIKQP